MTGRRRILVDRVGGPEVLRVGIDDVPEPGPGQALVRVLAAGVARADLLMRAGRYPGRAPRPPFVPGWDVTGVVEALGPGAPGGWLGRRVTALVLTGGNASHACVAVDDLIPLPDGIDMELAACLPLNYVTAYEMLRQAAGVREGERVLVYGAAGGVGTALLDVARNFGARPYGVASSRDRHVVESFGARFLDRDAGTSVAAPTVHAVIHGGADVVLDPLGGASLRRSWHALRPGGRLVSYGFLAAEGSGGAHMVASLLRLRMWSLLPNGRRATFYRLSVATRRHPARVRAALTTLVSELDAGRLRPLIAAHVPLDRPARAHQLADGHVRGKVLLIP